MPDMDHDGDEDLVDIMLLDDVQADEEELDDGTNSGKGCCITLFIFGASIIAAVWGAVHYL